MSAKKTLGRQGEDAAVRYLTTRLGWTVVERNWRCPEGELDIIAYDGRQHVVCEVKTRRDAAFGTPVEGVGRAKAARLRRLAGRWGATHGIHTAGIRVDVIGLLGTAGDGFTLDHLRGVC
ncbi:YraN family protein [Actinomadura craniellae]|uniref:UPF0102 protein DPM19_25450 n=1 Tax=Actinomadura craniellae TaxID=2231787 RepID=A0A365H068_9ACTN|nr:YraN family protein [Actinomadura craniellae]RAY12484.1 YraN family protein [Actinomadura craniellae]